MGQIGVGVLRNTIKLDDAMNGMDTDIVAQGPLLIGAGLGYTKHLSNNVEFVFDLSALAGLAVASLAELSPVMNSGVSADLDRPGCRPVSAITLTLTVTLTWSATATISRAGRHRRSGASPSPSPATSTSTSTSTLRDEAQANYARYCTSPAVTSPLQNAAVSTTAASTTRSPPSDR